MHPTSTLEIAHLSPGDLADGGAVVEAAFGRLGMSARLADTYALSPEHWFCARQNGRLVGTVGAYPYGPSAAIGTKAAIGMMAATGMMAAIGMMAVHPDAQRQGVGLRLMQHLVAHLSAAGYAEQFLEASTAGARLYPKLDFLSYGATLRMVRHSHIARPLPLPAYSSGRSGRQVLVRGLLAPDLPRVVAYDARVFGAERQAILCSFLVPAAGRAFVAEDSAGDLIGYLMAGPGQLGPWAAQTPVAAELLLRAALSLDFASLPRVTFPAENQPGRALLARHGFVEAEGLLHMRRGAVADPRRRREYYGHASLMLG
jgi:predicted N-acetyltransferase YhbS